MEDLDPPEPRGPKSGHALFVAVLIVALVIVLNVGAQLVTRTTPGALPSLPKPSAAALAPSTVETAFALHVEPRDAGSCGSFTATSPGSTFVGGALAVRRIDADIVLAADPDWAWCLAGARVFAEGVELIGILGVRGRQTRGGERPVLRDATFGAEVPVFGSLGPSELIDVNGYQVLRLRAVADPRAQPAFIAAASNTSVLTLRLDAMAGPWTFGAVPLVEGPLAATGSAHGVRFTLHDLRVLADAVATTLYTLSDTPDPGIISYDWDAIDDTGTIYRQLPDRRIAGTLPGFYRAFSPSPPLSATKISFAIRRIHLAALDEFATDLTLR